MAGSLHIVPDRRGCTFAKGNVRGKGSGCRYEYEFPISLTCRESVKMQRVPISRTKLLFNLSLCTAGLAPATIERGEK